MAALALWSVAKKKLVAQKAVAQIILVGTAMVFILFLGYPNLIMTRIYPVKFSAGAESLFNGVNSPGRLEIKSASERVESIKNSWPIIKKHWAGGAGLGNYTLAMRNELKPKEQSYYYQPAHNVFLLAWGEIGIFGTLLFAGTIAYFIILNWKIRNDDKYINSIINLAILIALIVLLSFDHWLWSLHFGVLFFWLVLGFVARGSLADNF